MSVNFLFLQTGLVFVAGMGARVLHSLFALSLGAETATVGLLLAVAPGVSFLTSWPIGRLVDRHGPRWFMIAGGAFGVAGALLPALFQNLPALFASALLLGLSSTIVNVIVQVAVGVLSRPGEVTRNYANYALVSSVVAMIGPFIAGFSIDHAGYAATAYNLAVLTGIATLMITLHSGRIPLAKAPGERRRGLRETLRDPRIVRIIVLSSLIQMAVDTFQSFLPVYAHGIGLSASAIGAVMALYAVANFLSRAVLQRLVERLGIARLLTIALWMGAVGALLIPMSSNLFVLATVCFLYGLGMGVGFPITTLLVHESAGKEGRAGEAFGLRLAAHGVVRTAGPTVFGFVGSLAGMGAIFGVAAFVLGTMAYTFRARGWFGGGAQGRG